MSVRHDMSYQDFVRHLFDHKPVKPLEADFGYWQGGAERKAEYLTRLFRGEGGWEDAFTPRQVAVGLTFLELAGYLSEALAPAIPLERRLDVIRSMGDLFTGWFTRVCGTKRDGGNGLVSDGWWEGLGGFPGEPALLAAALDSLERALGSANETVQESALHGLSHLQEEDPPRVAAIIDAYLAAHPDLREFLRGYAESARKGELP